MVEDQFSATFGKCHRKLAKTSFRVAEELETETIVAAIDEKCTLPSDSAISAVHISESFPNRLDFSDYSHLHRVR